MKNFIFGAITLWSVIMTAIVFDVANKVDKLQKENESLRKDVLDGASNRMNLLNDITKVMLAKFDKEKSEE